MIFGGVQHVIQRWRMRLALALIGDQKVIANIQFRNGTGKAAITIGAGMVTAIHCQFGPLTVAGAGESFTFEKGLELA